MLVKFSRPLFLALAAAVLPGVAQAHTGTGHLMGMLHGFQHPISGLDHILAMVLVGVFAAQIGGRAVWLVPVSFLAALALGGALGVAGVQMPFLEVGIAMSVVILGAIVALVVKAPLPAAMGLVGLFAIFHGYAHGAEMPLGADAAAYAAGFMVTTAVLHTLGIGIGLSIGRMNARHGALVARSAGSLASIAGIGLLIAAV
ncbi:HupE/UreJ family protein [Humitalea sp. 24SJ18S-53]|uniref:HupE/UreJ family protein n=1 Tax=Humitalea sp. 24SJ18S-53 TaxID=3422307 RepID=UPI003D67B88A